MIAVSSCAGAPGGSAKADTLEAVGHPRAAGIETGEFVEVFGRWRVTAVQQPGVSGVSPDESGEWIGTPAEYSDTLARLGTHQCATPAYRVDTISPTDFLDGHRIHPTVLGLGESVERTIIGCPALWVAPGATLYARGQDLLAPWDGAFLVLRRH
jgi:hypothetical protein